jgi:hypothetical protein
MGDEDDPALTQAAPTEMSDAANTDTEASMAWALEDDIDEHGRRLQLSARAITIAASVASLVAVVAAALAAGYYLRGDGPAVAPPNTVTTTASTSTVIAAPPPPGPAPKNTSPLPSPPSTVTVRETPPVGAIPSVTTYIGWDGAACIQVRFPDTSGMVLKATCDPTRTQTVHHPVAVSGSFIGADPIMGQATPIRCRVVVDATQQTLFYDSGTAGDGHDINCIIKAP